MIRLNRLRLHVTLLLILIPRCASAGDPGKLISQYVHDRWTTDNGYPGGQVNAIAQTPDGYLWVGTDRGLLRFDGLTFTPVSVGQPNQATHVLGLVTDSDGDLWVRLEGPSVFRYHNGKFDIANSDLHSSEVGVLAMSRGIEGSILVSGLVRGTIRYRLGKREASEFPKLPSGSLIMASAETSDGRVWLGTRDQGLFYLDHGRTVAVSNGLPDPKINSLLPIGDGKVWIGTDHGAALWDGTSIVESHRVLEHLQILTMATDADRSVWFGTSRGLFRLNSTGKLSPDARSPLLSTQVTALFEDREGDLWIGRSQSIERLRDSAFVTYSIKEGLPAESNGPIYADSGGRVWIAPAAGGLYRIAEGQREAVVNVGLVSDVIYSMSGLNDELWIGRRSGGLTRLSGKQNHPTTYTAKDGLAQNSVYSVHENRDGTVWAGTLSGGISCLKDGVFTTFTTADGLGSNSVASIEEARDGTMWFGTSGGLNRFSNTGWRLFTERDGLPSDEVNVLLEDSLENLWIGTAAGLARLRSDRVQTIPSMPELLREPILGISEDGKGWLWIATSSHVLQVGRDRLIDGSLKAADVKEYGLADGLESIDGVKRERSVVKDSRGRIWFSMNRGVSVVDPNRANAEGAPAIAHIDDILVDGTPVNLQEQIRIPSSRQRIEFNYGGLSLGTPERIRFRYRLDSFDHQWSEPASTRRAVYTNLGPGVYKFRLLASNGRGAWNGTETAIQFKIDPAFWQTWWFRTSFLLALVVTIWLFYRLRMIQMAQQLNLRFEERLAERMRISQELHDTLLQGVLSASMQLHVAAEQVPENSPAKPLLTRVLQLMGQVNEEGRNALRGLRSSTMSADDLKQALSRIPDELAVHGRAGFRVIVEGVSQPLHPVIRDEVYRISREALSNAFRHAQASTVEIEVEYATACLHVTVRDNGCGIDPLVLSSGRDGHFGLPGMRERAERIGAQVKVYSRPGAGTEVELRVPGKVAYQGGVATRFHWPRWRKSQTLERRMK